MPWLDASGPSSGSAQAWRKVLRGCLLKRLPPEQLAGLLEELAREHPSSSIRIAEILVSFRASKHGSDDPLFFHYAQVMLQSKHMTTADFLVMLLEHSRFYSNAETAQLTSHTCGLPTCEERAFTMLAQLYSTDALEVRHQSVHNLIFAITRWLHAVQSYEAAKQLESSGLHAVDNPSFGMYEALAHMVLVVYRNKSIRAVAKFQWWKQRRPAAVAAMRDFELHVLQWMHSQFAGQLQALTRMPPFVETDADGRPIFTGQEILDSVSEVRNVQSRPGLYVWLNACLCGRPLTDDSAMLSYLQARYATDYQSMAVDLLVASFDVLTNAMIRKESRQSVKVIRSFICNKVPLVLAVLAGFIATSGMTLEACIQMAFMSSITEDILPPISAGASDVREMLKRTKLEFLQACALHHLVSEGTIAQILHEPSMALPRVTKYNRDGLVAQCNNNVGRLELLADELQNMQGNAGAVAGCIVQVITNLCMSKDTMSLKTVCNALIRKIPEMDIVLQYTLPAGLLFPLCQLLNEWVHDQDQTEFTPAYEEFASILLFTMAVMHRYNLDDTDVGLTGSDTFISRLSKHSATSRPLSSLTEEQSAQLAQWIEGLYTTDEHGETSGISDDVMRQCPPQSFYLLVPTLFEQSALACRAGSLSMATFKGGLELLLEPFLLPSLICGLGWLVKRSWEDHGDAEILLQMLDKLLRPSSSSQDMQAMHRAILAIVATRLVRSLQDFQRRRPDKKEAGALLELLKPYVGLQRVSHISKSAVVELASVSDGSVGRGLRNIVREMVVWASSVGPGPPPKYTHSIFVSMTNALGEEAVIRALVDELKESPDDTDAVTLDVCTSMICAPTSNTKSPSINGNAAHPSSHTTLRDFLNYVISDSSRLLKMPAADAEWLVRLNRRVEAQSAMPHIQQIPLNLQAQESTDQVLQDLGLTDADVSGAAAGDQSATMGQSSTVAGFSNEDLNSALDQSVNLAVSSTQDLGNLTTDPGSMQVDQSQDFFGDLDLGMDMGQQPQQSNNLGNGGTGMLAGTNNGQSNPEEDIFAGLDMGNMDDDFNFS